MEFITRLTKLVKPSPKMLDMTFHSDLNDDHIVYVVKVYQCRHYYIKKYKWVQGRIKTYPQKRVHKKDLNKYLLK